MPSITPFDAYQREWARALTPLFFETMRTHPAVFRGRFPMFYDPSPFARETFTLQDNGRE